MPDEATGQEALKGLLRNFHGDGFFPWQFSNAAQRKMGEEPARYDEQRNWGGFSREPFNASTYTLPDWAIGPFTKYARNPIFAPAPGGWDGGHFGGGVHNGSVLKKDGRLYYVYRLMALALEADLDYILFGGSGTISLASPALAAQYAIPALPKWSRMAKDAGLPAMIHSCGKNRALADLLVAHTDVGMLNPVEPPPMGDVDLAEIKRTHGRRLAFMGNLHTTDVMLNGTPDSVGRKAVAAMRAAGRCGGFVLSTGDQCGRDTPDENIFAVVEAARKYGRYDQATGELPDLPDGGA